MIVQDRILTVRMRDDRGDFFVLPGGGQRHGETLYQTLQREVWEEVGGRIEIGELLYVREYIGCNHRYAHQHRNFHQLEHVFRTKLLNPAEVCPGECCDNRQVDIGWLPLAEVADSTLYPETLKAYFAQGASGPSPLYLGDCF